MSHPPLPVPATDGPHWRVNLRAKDYRERFPGLRECFDAVEHTKVRLRGWDYPHLSNMPTERGQGTNWVASWSDFMGHVEYWRLYQSGQFLHHFRVRESEPSWNSQLRATTRQHLGHIRDIDWAQVPGFISVDNCIYSVTEIFEFAARLSQTADYGGGVDISIQLNGVRGFVLTTGWDRAWMNYYAASEDILGRSWYIQEDLLVADPAGQALKTVVWFLERFGWLNPSVEVLKRDQENFLKGRL